jgi:hypothetical protein
VATHLDLFVDFAVSGEVCGAGLGTEPGAWVDALGPQYVDNELVENTLIRYFGIVTATFGRSESGRWLCQTIGIKPGDVARFPDMVPGPVADRYGAVPGRVPFDAVADRLTAAGAEIHHVRRVHEASLEEYWVPAGRVLFAVISPYQSDQISDLRLGDVYSVSTDIDATIQPTDLTRYR